jgi:hypothetical protein
VILVFGWPGKKVPSHHPGVTLYLRCSPIMIHIFTRMIVKIDGVWIGNWIYWTLRYDNDYTLQFSVTHTHTHTHTHTSVHSHVVSSRFPVTASNRGHSGTIRVSQRPASNSNGSKRLSRSCYLTDSTQLTAYKISARIAQKTPSLCCCLIVKWRIPLLQAQPSGTDSSENIIPLLFTDRCLVTAVV